MYDLPRRLLTRAGELNIRRMSAALALYLLMSFAPLLVVAIGLAGLVVGPSAAESQVLDEIRLLLGAERAAAIADAVAQASQPTASLQATLLGLLGLLWTGSRLFFELERDLAEIWGSRLRRRPPGWRSALQTVRRRLISIGQLLAVGLALLAAILTRAALAALDRLVTPHLPGRIDLASLMHDLWLLVLIALVLGLVYRLVPESKPSWRAALSAGLAAGGTLGLGLLGIAWLTHLTGERALLAAALSPLIGLGGLYLAAEVFVLGAVLCRELDRSDAGRSTQGTRQA